MTSTVNTTSPSMTFHNMTIEELNREQVLIRIPATIVVTITMILGLIGNSLTIYVYGFRLKMTPTYLFVVMLAITDFITCSILCPLTIVIYVYPMMATLDAICKSAKSLGIFTGFCNSGLLCSITVERYRRVCCPLKRQITMKYAKIITLCIFVFSAVQGTLVILNYGSVKKPIIYPGIYSHSCTFNIYKIVSTFHLLVAISVISLMIVLYAILLQRLKKDLTKTIVQNAPPPVSGNNSCQKLLSGVVFLNKTESNIEIGIEAAAESSGTKDKIKSIEIYPTDNTSDTPSVLETSSPGVYSGETTSQSTPATKQAPLISIQQSEREINSVRRIRESSDRLQRTTITMMLITVIYIITYIPSTCVVFVNDKMSTTAAIFYCLASMSFYVNSCANPIIYGYRNQQFVDEVKTLFRFRY